MTGSGTISVEKLRVWLLVGAGLLVGVIAAFLGYAHYRARRVLKELPGRLGMDIRQETNGFTYSQSNGPNGRTIYTIHAAKMVQRKDGKVTLHDVGIVLYGNAPVGSNRVDRIYGNEFEYDQSAGLIRAMGEVHIDLQAPAPVDANAKVEYAKGHGETPAAPGDERMIHVKTSGLVFLQKLATAATDQDLEFEYHGMTGHARGAEYNSDTGVLILQSAVRMNGIKDGQPVVLTATRAELDRQRQQTMLMGAEYTVVGGKTGTRRAKADRVTAYLRHDGSVERGIAEGSVSLRDDAGATLTAARGEVHLDGKNQPQLATLSGGVRMVSDEALRQARGEAEEAKADFDKAGLLKHVALGGGGGAVHLHERLAAGAGKSGVVGAWSERDVVAKSMDMDVVAKKGQRAELREVKAVGDARMTVVTPPAAGAKAGHQGVQTSVLSGDRLTADFVERDGRTHLKAVHGVGHAGLRRVSGAGAIATSQGETLEAEFRSAAGGVQRVMDKGVPIGFGADEIATVVQQGHVSMTNLPAPKAALKAGVKVEVAEEKASADRAVYDGASEKMTLTGAVQLSDADSVVWADKVVMDRETGDGVAEGSVKASYVQMKDAGAKGVAKTDAEPVHVMAARGELKHDAGQAKFYGDAGRPARFWQGASQVEAPVLEFAQRERRLVARGDGKQGMVVHAVFVSAGSPSTGSAAGSAKAAKGARQVPVRVASHEMTYDDIARRADFSGGVQVEDADGTMRSEQAVVYLKATDSGPTEIDTKKSASFMGGRVERMVASGRVDLSQPGRRASGEQLVYTAGDGMFVMTGGPGAPPKMMDEAQGAITGASLRFHAGDNSVAVTNGPDGVAGQRVRSETRVKQ